MNETIDIITITKKTRSERLKFIIFSLIGIFNTIFDVALYFVMYNVTKSILVANLVSTTAAFIGSYLLNSKLTFKNQERTAKSFLEFVAVTLFGLWVLQTVAIYGITHAFSVIPASIWIHLGGLQDFSKTVLPKLMATAITFIWNYVWYSRVVFKEDKPIKQRTAIAFK
jgi:putative flippase GtrA